MGEFEEYTVGELKREYATSLWLEGCACLRCHEYGILTLEMKPNKPFCPICGLDPLMHGPTREDIPKVKTEFMNGSRAHRMWLDEILGTDV